MRRSSRWLPILILAAFLLAAAAGSMHACPPQASASDALTPAEHDFDSCAACAWAEIGFFLEDRVPPVTTLAGADEIARVDPAPLSETSHATDSPRGPPAI